MDDYRVRRYYTVVMAGTGSAHIPANRARAVVAAHFASGSPVSGFFFSFISLRPDIAGFSIRHERHSYTNVYFGFPEYFFTGRRFGVDFDGGTSKHCSAVGRASRRPVFIQISRVISTRFERAIFFTGICRKLKNRDFIRSVLIYHRENVRRIGSPRVREF